MWGINRDSAPPRLMVPQEQLAAEIDERLTLGSRILAESVQDAASLEDCRHQYRTWTEYNKALVLRSFDLAAPADEYSASHTFGRAGRSLAQERDDLHGDIKDKIRRLESLKGRLGLYQLHPAATTPASTESLAVLGTDVFIVHGHDRDTKETVARFLSSLTGREPIILHEQPNQGRTIIEKFEACAARTARAVVLLTGDDTGSQIKGGTPRLRARQNVVLELGFFLGKIGRERVIILCDSGVELPSDLRGMSYIILDDGGAWRNAIAREFGLQR